jgi:hypothetical protein
MPTMTSQHRDTTDPSWRAARVRRLTDPLGASGQRRTGERIQRERLARRTVLTAAVGAFMALLAAIAGGASPDQQATPADTGIVYAVDQNGNVQAVRVVEREIAQARSRSS